MGGKGWDASGLGAEELFGFGNVAGVVNVDDFAERVGFQVEAAGDKGALVITHARHALLNALDKDVEGGAAQTVNAARDVRVGRLALGVVKAADGEVGGGFYVKRFFVIDVVGDGHEAV